MYFEVKAFSNGVRRFENLDNIDELNTFIFEREQLGFTKFIIKSFDQNGFRKRRFVRINEFGTLIKMWKREAVMR